MNILFVGLANQDGRSCHRYTELVHSILRTRRHSSSLISLNSFFASIIEIEAKCEQADVIVIYGIEHPRMASAIQHWKARNKIILLDLPTVSITLLQSNKYASSLFLSLPLVDAICVSSNQLAEGLQEYNRVVVIPNYLELDQYLNIMPVQHEGIVLGWKFDQDESDAMENCSIMAALSGVIKARPQVRIGLWGISSDRYAQLGLPGENYFTHFNFCDEDWPRPLSYVDIGLAPLFETMSEKQNGYDILEFMVMRIPWVASQSPSFIHLRPYGWLVQNDRYAWERILLDMIDHLDAYRQEAAGDAFLSAISQGIDENIVHVLSVFYNLQNIKN